MAAILSIVLPSSKYPITTLNDLNRVQASVSNLTAFITDISSRRAATGEHGDIWKASYMGVNVALKTVGMSAWSFPEKMERNKRLMNELMTWTALKHPNILELYGVCEHEPYGLALISPWMELGNVKQYLEAHPRADRTSLVLDVARALAYMHSLEPPIVHGNLNPENVLVRSSGRACLAGFAVSGFLKDTEADLLDQFQMYPRNPRWLAPEQLYPADFGMSQFQSFSLASDSYSFGLVVYEIYADRIPLYHIGDLYMVPLAVRAGEHPAHPGPEAVRRGLCDGMWSIVQDCWRPAADRPNSDELLRRVAATDRSDTGSWMPPNEDISGDKLM
ncbi:kinase-like protein [Calocera cornea HHB12733]|uniref:Kinase-like protein n=1 Tax=Calocera cornea HHB12733 TaxID=1353952 RepID=A0A165EI64_9BASI|nr:kinase-like protein [Calocera cornea HHB12733]